MLSRVQCSLVLSNEIANVATALRESARYDNDYEEPQEDTLLEDFFSLQQKVLYMRQWEVVDPFEYVAPFLDAIRSERVGAMITGTALGGLWKMLMANVVPAAHYNSAQTLKHIVETLLNCHFQTSSNSAHEMVVTRLVNVFTACVCADVGVLLGADDVTLITMNVWKWCELSPLSDSMIKPSSILVQSVRQNLHQLLSCLFSRLRTCRILFEDDVMAHDFLGYAIPGTGHKNEEEFSVIHPSTYNLSEDAAVANLCCGLEPFHDILVYCVEPMRLDSESEMNTDRILFSLQMLHTCIVHAGETLSDYAVLLGAIRCDVFPSLVSCLRRTSQRIHASVYQVVFAMYKLFGNELLLQIESFFQTSVLRLCEGRNCPSTEHQEIALEALLDFCGYPGFLRDIYINLDCRVERTNLYEDICTLLSKTAFPVKTPLHAVHMISMEGLLAMLLTLSSACGGDTAPHVATDPKPQLPTYINIWTDILNGIHPSLKDVLEFENDGEEEEEETVTFVRMEKALKKRITVAVDHFNRDYKKGFQYLQTIKLLPAEKDAKTIAHFLRVCPNLNGHVVGDMLGDADAFYQDVLENFTETFNFSGKSIEAALREYFDAFKVPGEAQKIDRVVGKFSKVYFVCQTNEVFKNDDAVHILAYSIIMLNTDLHKPEIKNKMTLEQFIRNNRGINNGEDFPKEMLEQIYHNIKQQPMRIGDTISEQTNRWIQLNQMSKTPRGRKSKPLKVTSSLDKDMFTLIWGPSVAAISVILDQADDSTTVQTTLTGLKLAAKIAYFHGVDEVIDSLVVSLFKNTVYLSLRVQKALAVFGMREKEQLATETGFFIANKYMSSLGNSGWRSVMDCVIRLCQLGVLRSRFWEDDEDQEGPSEPTFDLSPESNGSIASGSVSATLWPWRQGDTAFTSAELAAKQKTLDCIKRCEIRTVFRDTKFLKVESLVELVKAICSAHQSDEKMQSVCLDLAFYITIRNRDRIQYVWPELETHLVRILHPDAHYPHLLVKDAVFGILKVCHLALTRKGISGILLRILQTVPNIPKELIDTIAIPLAQELLSLVKQSASLIEEGWAWDAICNILCLTASSEPAFSAGIDALTAIAHDGEHITFENFNYIQRTLRYYQDIASPETVRMLIDLLEEMIKSLQKWKSVTPECPSLDSETLEITTTDLEQMWCSIFIHLRDTSMNPDPEIRNHTVMVLQRCVMMGETLKLSPTVWEKCLKKDVMEMIQFLLKKKGSRDYPKAETTLRQALKIMTKMFLQFLDIFKEAPDFPETWTKVLQLLQQSFTGQDDELSEAIPEELRNLLLVMNKEGILVKSWTDENGMNLWDMTWRKAKDVSFSLKPELLEDA